MNPPSAEGAPKAPAAGAAPKAGAAGGAPNVGAGAAPKAGAPGAAPNAGVGLGVRNPELGGPPPNPLAGGAPKAGAPNVFVGGGRLLPNTGAAGADWLPKAGAGLEDRKPPGALEPKPLEGAGAAPKPVGVGTLVAPNENAGWLADALVAGAWMDAPKEKAGAAGAVDAELPNAVEGLALDELPKPPLLAPDPNALEPDPKAAEVEPKPEVVAGVWPNVAEPDEPKPLDAAD